MSKTRQREAIPYWRKASYSIANGQCLEAAATPDQVLVRDSVNVAGGRLEFPVDAWQKFTAQLKGLA